MAAPLRSAVLRAWRVVGTGILFAAACGGKEPPSADRPAPPAPDLTGRAVMVLPVQPTAGAVPAGLDAEIAFWLADHGNSVRWVFPPALEQALHRSPALQDIALHALAVSSFRRAEVRRIGDPLFGDLRRLGALVDTRYALVPVAGGYVPRPDGAGRVELAAALIDTMGGAVLWFGVVGGEPGVHGAPTVVASAAQALARTFFPGER